MVPLLLIVLACSAVLIDADLGSACSDDTDCSPTMLCVFGACECKPGLTYNPTTEHCSSNLGSACSDDTDCSPTMLCVFGACECKPGLTYNPTTEHCRSSLDAECSSDVDCFSPDMLCYNSICRCNPGLNYNFTTKSCEDGCHAYGSTYQEYQGQFVTNVGNSLQDCFFAHGTVSLDTCLQAFLFVPLYSSSSVMAYYMHSNRYCVLLSCVPDEFASFWPLDPMNTTYIKNCEEIKDCQLGQYYDEVARVCDDCDAGSFSNTTLTTACTPCPAGQHQPLEAQSGCTQCQAHTVSGTGQTNCSECPLGKVPNGDQSDCINCPAGSFSAMGVCSDCAPNMVSTEGSAECQACAPGTVPNQNQSECIECDPGTFSAGGQVSCSQCDPGFFSSEPAQASCNACAGGTYPNAQQTGCDDCSPGFYSTAASENCSSCPSNLFSTAGQSSCSPCPDGKVPNSAHSGCIECPAGTYAESGSETCAKCSPTTYSTAGQSVCVRCDPGKEPNENQTGCIACVTGTYSSSGIECNECPPGAVATTGQPHCSFCAEGTVPNNNKSACVNCPAGEFSWVGMTACEPCDTGKVSNEGQGNCSYCDDGMVPNDQQSGCVKCKAGNYAESGDAACSPCLNGTYSTEGMSSCKPCDAGFYPNPNKTGCDPCKPGTWSSSGDACCMPCGHALYSPGGQASCEMCEAGSIVNAEKSGCVLCLAGTYASLGDTTCTECEQDLISSAGAPECIECPDGFMASRDKTKCRENLAHEKETKQWLTKGMHFPGKAVDGRFYHFCSRTKKRENPWWHVKLEGTAHITDVALQNRKDCCGQQLHDIDIFVGATENDTSQLCGSYVGPAATGERIYINCSSPVEGRYVTVVKNTQGRKERLTLCEVFVFGYIVQYDVCEKLNPCKNGGTCTNKGRKGYECCCSKDWTGPTCEEKELPPKPEGPHKECIDDLNGDPNGVNYFGTQSITTSGRKCKPWAAVYHHRHAYHRLLAAEGNYCRNRLHGIKGRYRPWCYTMDPNKHWEFCDNIPMCSNPTEVFPPPPIYPGCYTRIDKGQSYSGPVDFTASGKRCARWENELHNYCRNPVGQRRKPWCWAKDGSIEECDLEICALPPPVPGENVCFVDTSTSTCVSTMVLTGDCYYEFKVHDKCNVTIVPLSRMVYDVYLPYAIERLHWLAIDGPQRHTSPYCDATFEVIGFGKIAVKTPTCGWCAMKTWTSYIEDVSNGDKMCPVPNQGPPQIAVGK